MPTILTGAQVSPSGNQGPAGSVAVGTTTTVSPDTPASVVNVGTSTASILEFSIPQGIQGEQGIVGPIGSLPVGMIILWPNTTPPDGWLSCDGSEVSRVTYPDLYAIVGDAYGAGDGSTTFNLPDFRGRVPVGVGQGAGLANRIIGSTGGEEVHALSIAELAAHSHNVTDPTHLHSVSDPGHLHNMDHCHAHDHYHTIGAGQFNHNHSFYDPQHQHPTYDPTHAHSISDPGHAHSAYYHEIKGGNTWGGGSGLSYGGVWGGTDARGVGVGIYGAGTGVVADWTTTRCSNYAATLPAGNTGWISQTDANLVNTAYASQTNAAWVNTVASGTSIGIYGAATGISIQNTGSGTAHNIMQPFLVLQYIVHAVLEGAPLAPPDVPIADVTQDGLLRRVSGLTTDFVDGTNRCQDLETAIAALGIGGGTTPPVADATQDGLLRQVSGLATDFIDGTNNCQDLATAIADLGISGGGPPPPIADTTQDGLLRRVSGLTTDFVDGSNNCQDLATAVAALGITGGAALPVGTIIGYPSLIAPPAWMVCDGSEISRATYPELFALMGTTYGAGDGSTTFNLPNRCGRVGIGAGLGSGLTDRVLGLMGGEEDHVLSVAELATHTHIQDNHSHTLNLGALGWAAGGVTGVGNTSGEWGGTSWVTATNQNAGSSIAHNNMQPFLVLNYIIKVSADGGSTANAPIADTTQDGLLRTVSGLTTDFVDGTNNCQNLEPAVRNILVSTRSYNSIGNSTFEVNQRRAGDIITFPVDRWNIARQGAITFTSQQTDVSSDYGVDVPGTTFKITKNYLRIISTKQIATLAAADGCTIYTTIEGSRLRELIGDATSAQILVRTDVAPLTITLALRSSKDATTKRSITKLVTIPTAGVWNLLQVPNIARWASDGVFLLTPGSYGYELLITLGIGAGHSAMSPANDSWQSGDFWGGPGMGSFFAGPVNSYFDLAFVQHSPGTRCGQLIDLPFEDNLRDSKRHYCKSANYLTAPCIGAWVAIGMSIANVAQARSYIQFPVEMAKAPTMRWTGNSAALNNIYVDNIGLFAVSSADVRTTGVANINLASTPTGSYPMLADWDAATGW
jgi:microcystin-dependent protein